MNGLGTVLAIAGLLGAGLVGGAFFAFSTFIMPALGRVPKDQGMRAMQQINITVFHPAFMGAFIGTAVLSLGCIIFGVWYWRTPGSPALMSGGALYLFGCFLLTGLGNVPLNEKLKILDPVSEAGIAEWSRYLVVWTRWNHVRTAACIAAVVAFAMVLLSAGEPIV